MNFTHSGCSPFGSASSAFILLQTRALSENMAFAIETPFSLHFLRIALVFLESYGTVGTIVCLGDPFLRGKV